MSVSTPGPRRRPHVLGVLLFLLATVAPGEIVLFTDGGWLPVQAFELQDERVRLELPGGGRMVVSIYRIERILDDEIVAPAEVVEVVPAPAGGDEFEVRYREGQTEPETPYGDVIFAAAARHGLNPALVAAVARAESAFDAEAVSAKGAQGLMQLMPATARRFGVEGDDAFDPDKNVDAGVRYLSWLSDRFNGRLEWILAAYNAGEGTVDRYEGVPPYRETQGFVRRILDDLGVATEADETGEEAAEAPPGPAPAAPPVR